MKQIVLSLVVLFATANSYAQCDGRYQEEIFDEVSVSTIMYSDVYGLEMDIYQPTGDLKMDRPLLILAHGGSFVAGTRENPSMISLGETFAKRGYVVASISYRLMSFMDLLSAEAALNGVARALGDGRAAVRYFRKTVAEGNVYGIDENQIYFGGNSAGGVIAIHAAFMQEEDITSAELLAALNSNGGIEGDSGNEGYSSEVRGAISLAGGIADVNFISSIDFDKLLISCHGDEDDTVPYDCGQPLSNPVLPELCGAGAILEHTTEVGFENHHHLVFEGAGHVPWEYGGSAEVAMINFVSENLYNNLDCMDVGVEDLAIENSLNIYPNPTKNKFSIKSLKRIYKVVISNLKGVELFRSENTSKLNIEHLPKGVYMVEIYSENQKVMRKKLVKM